MPSSPIYPPAPIPREILRSEDETFKFVSPSGKPQCTWKPGADKNMAPHDFKFSLQRPKILPNVLHAIGNTPLIRLNSIPKSYGIKCEMLAKCEYFNPGGSIKDRIALRMILDAEEKGLLKPGYRFIEPGAGNTALGLAMAAAIKGYKCTCVMPLRMSTDKVNSLKALGADVVRTPKVKLGDEECMFKTCQRLCKEIPNSIVLDQFRNACNPIAHYQTTAEEILEQCDGKVDAIVCGSGTGGTMTGIARKMKEKCPSCRMIGADPIGSHLAQPDELNKTDVTFFEMEGIGFDFLPTTLDRSLVSEWYKVSDKDSMNMSRRLVREEGILCGGSAGTAMCAAVRAAQKMKEGERLVVILSDGMRNYLSKFVSDPWMKVRDFIGIDDEKRWWWSFLPAKLLDLKVPKLIPSTTTCGSSIQHMSDTNQNFVFIEKDGAIIGVISSEKLLNSLMEMKCTLNHPVERVVDPVRIVDEDAPLGKICAIVQIEHFVLIETKTNQQHQGNSITTKKYATAQDLLLFINTNKPTD